MITYNSGVDIGYAFGRFREMRARYEFGDLESTLDRGLSDLLPLSGQCGTTRVVFRQDTRNGPLVPTLLVAGGIKVNAQ